MFLARQLLLRHPEGNFHGKRLVSVQRVNPCRDVTFRGRLSGEEDEHVPGRALSLVQGQDRGNAMLAFVVDDHQRIQEVAVVRPSPNEFRGGLVQWDTCRLGHIVHERDPAIWRHVVAAEVGSHGVVDTVAMHAFQSRLAKHGSGRDGTQVEKSADPLVAGVVQFGAARGLDAVENHSLKNEQGLEDGVELQIVVDFVKMTGLTRVITLKVFLSGQGEGLEFQAANATIIQLEQKAAILRFAEG